MLDHAPYRQMFIQRIKQWRVHDPIVFNAHLFLSDPSKIQVGACEVLIKYIEKYIIRRLLSEKRVKNYLHAKTSVAFFLAIENLRIYIGVLRANKYIQRGELKVRCPTL